MESPATLAPSYPLGTGPGHCGIRSTISVTFPISQLEAGSLLDLTPSLIFGGDLMLFLYLTKYPHPKERINRFLAGAAFTGFLSPDSDFELGCLSINEA